MHCTLPLPSHMLFSGAWRYLTKVLHIITVGKAFETYSLAVMLSSTYLQHMHQSTNNTPQQTVVDFSAGMAPVAAVTL
jgi:hypothetical protein